jgi:hypothetical protein
LCFWVFLMMQGDGVGHLLPLLLYSISLWWYIRGL